MIFMRTTATMTKLCSDENKYKHDIIDLFVRCPFV